MARSLYLGVDFNDEGVFEFAKVHFCSDVGAQNYLVPNYDRVVKLDISPPPSKPKVEIPVVKL